MILLFLCVFSILAGVVNFLQSILISAIKIKITHSLLIEEDKNVDKPKNGKYLFHFTNLFYNTKAKRVSTILEFINAEEKISCMLICM